LGPTLSRYLREANHSVSTVVVGFTGFEFLFYSLIITASRFLPVHPSKQPLPLLTVS
jgi:hypothetical protein